MSLTVLILVRASSARYDLHERSQRQERKSRKGKITVERMREKGSALERVRGEGRVSERGERKGKERKGEEWKGKGKKEEEREKEMGQGKDEGWKKICCVHRDLKLSTRSLQDHLDDNENK